MDLAYLLEAQASDSFTVYGQSVPLMTDQERIEYIRNMVLAATEELHEALRETEWKPWDPRESAVNGDAMMTELVDALMFVVNLMLASRPDLTPTQLAYQITHQFEVNRMVNKTRHQHS